MPSFDALATAIKAADAQALRQIIEACVSATPPEGLHRHIGLTDLLALPEMRAFSPMQSALITTLAEVADINLVGAIPDRMPIVGANPDAWPPAAATFSEVLGHASAGHPLHTQLHNRVRVCGACSKANAYTLTHCNGCRTEIGGLEISHTPNIFTSFVLGIERADFPLHISMRKQDRDMMVFDDILALSSCHLNCIPAAHHLPDFRRLFEHPAQGLDLLEKLQRAALECLETSFWSDPGWRGFAARPFCAPPSFADLSRHVVMGLNFPPSQYQLHLHCMLPPFTPAHQRLYFAGAHFIKGRWFPLEFVLESLRRLVELDLDLEGAGDKEIDHTVTAMRGLGVDYDEVFGQAYARYGASQRLLWNFGAEDFRYLAVGDRLLVDRLTAEVTPIDKTRLIAMNKADKHTMQNWGRPYDAAQRPSGSFYRFAKQAPLPDWPGPPTTR